MKSVPYARFLVAAFTSSAVLAILLNRVMHEWFGAMHLAMVIVFEVTIVVHGVRSLIRWIINRRRPDDDFPGLQGDYGLAA